jgi:hypothetical protein
MCKLLTNLLLVILKMVITFGNICVISMLNYICYSPMFWNLSETANSACLYHYLIYWIWMCHFGRFGCVNLLRKCFVKIWKMFSNLSFPCIHWINYNTWLLWCFFFGIYAVPLGVSFIFLRSFDCSYHLNWFFINDLQKLFHIWSYLACVLFFSLHF